MAGVMKRYADLAYKTKKYFDECDAVNERARQENEKKLFIPKPYTVSGLIYSLGITRREFETLITKPKFSFLLEAKARIEAFIEENSLNGGLSGTASSSSLKHDFGWGRDMPDEDTGEIRHLEVRLSDDARRLAQ